MPVCEIVNCNAEATEKVQVKAGDFGTITIEACTEHVSLFKEKAT
jgi:hypothetical protein